MNPGYKQTEFGVIPEEWELSGLQHVCREPITYGIVQCGPHVRDGIPYIRVSDMNEPELAVDDMLRTSEDIASKFARSTVEEGDLVYALRGKLGEVRQIRADLAGANLTQGTARLSPNDRVVSDYFVRALRDPRVVRQAELEAKGTTFREITLADLRRLKVLVPPLPEQRAIATALSDVDALLAALDRLLAKKRDLKQTAMQQLLTGQTRLRGFEGEWKITTFGNVVRHHAGNSALIKGKLSATNSAGFYPGYSASGQDVWCAHYEHEGFAIVVSAVGSRCGKAFTASGKWCAIANTHVVWPNASKVDSRFLGFFINDEDFWMKSGSGQPFVLFKQSFARPLNLPPLPEQTAIAAVLSDMDAELAALEQRRDKTRALKQGMMHELLTGRTRLLVAGAGGQSTDEI
jgi:type I restriction enzyme, S subunit